MGFWYIDRSFVQEEVDIYIICQFKDCMVGLIKIDFYIGIGNEVVIMFFVLGIIVNKNRVICCIRVCWVVVQCIWEQVYLVVCKCQVVIVVKIIFVFVIGKVLVCKRIDVVSVYIYFDFIRNVVVYI